MKRWTLLTVFLILGLIVISCAPKATPTPTPTKAPTKAPEKPKVEEVTIVAWTIGPDEPSFYRFDNLKDAVDRLNKKLEEEGSPYRVKLEGFFDTGSWGDYKQKYMMAAQAGEAPDIILSGHEDVAPWSEAGFIIALDDLIAKYSKTYDDIIPTLWNSVTYKGKKWGIPQDTEARPMYFSKTLLKKLGWSDDEINALPEKIKNGEFTLYDMLELAKEAQDKGVVEKGYGYWHRPKKGGDFYHIYFAFGGQMQDPETGKLVVVKDALKKWLQFHYDTVWTYETTPKDFIGTDWKIWHETVSAGDKALFWNGGTWHWAEWTQKYLDGNEQHLWDNVGFALIPSGEKGKPGTTLSHPLVYMVSSEKATGKKNQELAFRIITEATAADLNTRHAVNSGHLAILKSQLDYPEYTKNKFLSAVAYMVEYTNFQPNHPDYGTYDQIMFNALQAVEAKDLTVDDAVNTVIEEMQAELGDKVVIK